MTIWAGIDLGTSSIKIALIDDSDGLLAVASRPIAIMRANPGWSEQHPDSWVEAVSDAMDELARRHDGLVSKLAGIGLSGQMLGTVILDRGHKPLRPAILWNDQRATAECAELVDRVPDIGERTIGAPDPGIVAPKLIWLARHEPKTIEDADLLLLPKDYVRLCLTGEAASEPTDAAGTMMLDCATGRWDDDLCASAGWSRDRLPKLLDSWGCAGWLRRELVERWRTPTRVPVAAGAGDNFAGTIGAGGAKPGDTVISIGTSAVISTVDARFRPAPQKAFLTAAHAAPGAFLSMGVVMSATASLDWLGELAGMNATDLAGEAEAFAEGQDILAAPVMRPSLSGIRTPNNRPDAGGIIDGLTHASKRQALAYSLIEGVAFQIAECAREQVSAGMIHKTVRIVGGGSRSRLWLRLLATLEDITISVPREAALAANIGAARLARVAAGADSAADLGKAPAEALTVEPDLALMRLLEKRFDKYKALPISGVSINGMERK